MISTGGHLLRTAAASLMPSIDPGMSTSVKTMRISARVSKRTTASSAFAASRTSNPASSTKLAAAMRISASSSTMRTTALALGIGALRILVGDELRRRAPTYGMVFGSDPAESTEAGLEDIGPRSEYGQNA